MAAVMSNNFPASFPRLEIAGTIKPKIISGIAKPKKELKMALKVAKILPILSGKRVPRKVPSAIASTICNRRLFFNAFIIVNRITVKSTKRSANNKALSFF